MKKDDKTILSPTDDEPKKNKKQKLEKAIDENQEKKPQPKARHRRTRAEIQAEKQKAEQSLLRDDNFEIFRDIIKMLSDRDAEKYDIEKIDKLEFEPLAKNYAVICNYFLPAGKPIYFIIASATFQSIAMMSERKRKIDLALEQRESGKESSPPPVDTRKVRVGQESFSESDLTIKQL